MESGRNAADVPAPHGWWWYKADASVAGRTYPVHEPGDQQGRPPGRGLHQQGAVYSHGPPNPNHNPIPNLNPIPNPNPNPIPNPIPNPKARTVGMADPGNGGPVPPKPRVRESPA